MLYRRQRLTGEEQDTKVFIYRRLNITLRGCKIPQSIFLKDNQSCVIINNNTVEAAYCDYFDNK